MNVVDKAERSPRKCSVTGREEGPFVDFGVHIQPENPAIPYFLYLRCAVVEEAAKKLGMVPKREVDNLTDQLTALTDELAGVREDMRVMGEFQERFQERSAA